MAVLTHAARGTATSSVSGTTLTIVPTGTMIVGSTAFLVVTANSTTATATVADDSANAGAVNTWTQDGIRNSGAGTNRCWVFRSNVTRQIDSGATTITITFSAALLTKAVVALSVTGWLSAPSLDKTNGTGGSTSPLNTGTTAVTTSADEFILACYSFISAATPTFTDTTGMSRGAVARASSGATNVGTTYSWKETGSTSAQVGSVTTGTSLSGWAGLIVTYPAGVGGTVYTQSLSGSMSFSGSAVRLPQKQHAASLALAGVIVSRAVTGRRFNGVLAPGGVLSRATERRVTGGVSFSGALPSGLSHSMAASFTPVGGLGPTVPRKSLTAALAASGRLVNAPGTLRSVLAPTGTLNRATTKATPLAGAISFVGAHSRMFNYNQALSGAISFSGLMKRRSSSRMLSAVLAPAGYLMRALGFGLDASSLAPSGALNANTQRTLPGAILSFTGSFRAAAQKTFTGAARFSGSVAHGFGKALFASLRAAGALSSLYVAGPGLPPVTPQPVATNDFGSAGGGGDWVTFRDPFARSSFRIKRPRGQR